MMNIMHPTISLILPCYNITQYIPTCLESISKAAREHEEEIEIIIIDDGSTDGLEEKLVEVNSKYSLALHYFKYENSGVSEARNRGIKKANGDYIWFIDPDDTITEDSLDVLLTKIGGG